MMTRGEKEEIVKNLQASMKKANAVFVTNLIGVSSNDAVKIRKEIREAEGNVVITRNTLLERAAKGLACESIFKDLKGANAAAFAFGEAPKVAKALDNARKESEIVDIKAAVLDGKILSQADIKELVNLPSREEMLATLLATFNAPISAFVRVMDAIKCQKEEQQ